MKDKNSMFKKMVHDMRANFSVLQIIFEVESLWPADEDGRQVFKNGKICLYRMKKLIDQLAEETYGAQTIKEDPFEQLSQIPASKTGRILVVDDDDIIRAHIVEELRKRGHDVLALEKGEDLLNQSINLKDIRMAIVDYQFENSSLDGFDVIEYLQSQKLKRIHLCTGCYDDPNVIKRARDMGIVSIISKPVPERFWEIL